MTGEVLVLHVDADAFYASVEQRQKPSTAAVPVIVCGLGPRGVVATASYQARRFGVGSAMAMATATAVRQCPQGVFLAPRMSAYREHSAAIMAVLTRFANVLEQVSIDEAYLQVSPVNIAAEPLAAEVTAAVWRATGLRVSVGAGRSKLVAKLASPAAKPRGVRVVTGGQEQLFLDGLAVTTLPGVGPVAAARLRELGIDTVAQLRAQPDRLLQRLLGSAGAGRRQPPSWTSPMRSCKWTTRAASCSPWAARARPGNRSTRPVRHVPHRRGGSPCTDTAAQRN